MKAIMVTFDSLNRRFLEPYGCDWVKTPNFQRLADKCLSFDRNYCGSMPCIPARREMHTGRLNFLHRSWGPIEPFDDSMPEILKKNGIHSHLSSDHVHYWEDGGCTYHTRYSTWEANRGQEGDPWKAIVGDVEMPDHLGQMWRQENINRGYMTKEEELPQAKTFSNGLEFLANNHDADNWFLHIETFDPHEPFYNIPEFIELYEKEYNGPWFDWVIGRPVLEEEKPYVDHIRNLYASIVSLCDKNLGKVLDMMDEKNMWDDTLLIVNTDHGFLLGEQGWWGKDYEKMFLDNIARNPLFIHDPRSNRQGRNDCLVQTMDLAPTILEYFEIPIPKDMMGKPLRETIARDLPVRETALMGAHGVQICCTTGDQTYILAPIDSEAPLYNYTLMPTHMRERFSVEELKEAELHPPFDFTKGCPVLRTKADSMLLAGARKPNLKTVLYDMIEDPEQVEPISNPKLEEYFRKEIVRHLKENDAPKEQYTRVGLESYLDSEK